MLARHKMESRYQQQADFVFCTRTGRPFSQRNVIRALREAQSRARDEKGNPTFPELHARDEHCRPVRVPRGTLPSMHSFRHTAASRAPLAGESIDEIALLLGHRDANVTDGAGAARPDWLAVIDRHLATATSHPAGTTDRLLEADRQRPY